MIGKNLGSWHTVALLGCLLGCNDRQVGLLGQAVALLLNGKALLVLDSQGRLTDNCFSLDRSMHWRNLIC
jgi:hypothetical protein